MTIDGRRSVDEEGRKLLDLTVMMCSLSVSRGGKTQTSDKEILDYEDLTAIDGGMCFTFLNKGTFGKLCCLLLKLNIYNS